MSKAVAAGCGVQLLQCLSVCSSAFRAGNEQDDVVHVCLSDDSHT
jgi:hypothetical protein